MNVNLMAMLRDLRRRVRPSTQPLEALPPVPGMERAIEEGRCLYDGYQRGADLMFGTLADKVWRDPVFRRARAAANNATVSSLLEEACILNLFMMIKFFLRELDSQNIIEFGVYKGGSAIFMAMLLREYYPSARLYALDTFTGIPTITAGGQMPAGEYATEAFAHSSLPGIEAAARSLGLTNIEFVKGKIEDTAEEVCRKGGPFGLAHIDVVLYSATSYAQNLAWNYMTPGGYLVHDDATAPNWPGAMHAVVELIRDKKANPEQSWPQFIFRVDAEMLTLPGTRLLSPVPEPRRISRSA